MSKAQGGVWLLLGQGTPGEWMTPASATMRLDGNRLITGDVHGTVLVLGADNHWHLESGVSVLGSYRWPNIVIETPATAGDYDDGEG